MAKDEGGGDGFWEDGGSCGERERKKKKNKDQTRKRNGQKLKIQIFNGYFSLLLTPTTF